MIWPCYFSDLISYCLVSVSLLFCKDAKHAPFEPLCALPSCQITRGLLPHRSLLKSHLLREGLLIHFIQSGQLLSVTYRFIDYPESAHHKQSIFLFIASLSCENESLLSVRTLSVLLLLHFQY